MASNILHAISRDDAAAAGRKRFFTGIPCNFGHVAERYVIGGRCVECMRIKNAQYRDANGERIKACRSDRYRNNAREICKYGAAWRRNNREKCSDIKRRWVAKNISAVRENDAKYRRERYATNNEFRCIQSLRARFLIALRAEKITKRGSFSKSLGYSMSELVAHIERQFTKGMSWDNHGEWHIDHITPISVLVRDGITDPAVVNCLSNLRPLWAKENISKGSRRTSLI
jgi:hypothetical protein